MTSILLEDKSIENFEKALKQLQETSHAIIILACDENDFLAPALDPILKQCTLPIIGGIFPAIVYKNRQYNQGTILLGLKQAFEVNTLKNISKDKDYDRLIEEEIGALDRDAQTMFLFFDGISKNIDNIIQALFNNYGLSINYIGGSAGGRDFQKKPVLFSNDGLLEDAALLATTLAHSTIGVKHGWEPIEKNTYQITKSDGNIIYEIDYLPALDVYKEAVLSHLQGHFDTADFFTVAKSYPLGITRLSGDSIVRVVMSEGKDDSVVCTGDVQENAYVQILHANSEQLIQAAATAAKLSDNESYHKSFKLYIGCLARLLVLGDEFYKELETIYQEEELLVGALSLGEIANNKDHYLELYNSTAVIAKIADV